MNSQPEPSAAKLARFAAGLRLSDIPDPVVTRAKLHILDALGLGLASNVYDYGQRSAEGVAAMGPVGSCSVIGRPERLEPRDAALINGILIHGLDFDDTHLASIIHPTCTSLPCALALGESLGASGADVLTAFLAGAETSIRIGLAVDGGFHHVGYHATGVVSHFASAVTAGKLLGLDADRITAAQGIAGSTASGIQVFLEEGAWTKRFHPGWGAVAGITAALVAGSQIVGGFLAPRIRHLFRLRTSALLLAVGLGALTLTLIGVIGQFWVAVGLIAIWAMLFSASTPIRQSYINGMIPSRQRATILSFDSMLGSSGGVVVQPALGQVADTSGYATSYLYGAMITVAALPFILLSRRQRPPADAATGTPQTEASVESETPGPA